MAGLISTIRRWLIMSLALVVILAAVIVGLARFAFELFPGAQEQVRVVLAEALEREVLIAAVDLGWQHGAPSVHFSQVVVMNETAQGEWLRFDQLSVGFNLRGLLRGKVQPTQITLIEPVLDLSTLEKQDSSTTRSADKLGNTLAKLDSVFIEQGELHIPDPWNSQGFLRLTDVNLTLSSDGEIHQVEGVGLMPPSVGGELIVTLEAEGKFSQPEALLLKGLATLQDPEPGFLLKPVLIEGSRINFTESSLQLQFSGGLQEPIAVDLAAEFQNLQLSNQVDVWRSATAKAHLRQISASEDTSGVVSRGWQLTLDDLTVERAGHPATRSSGQLGYWLPDQVEPVDGEAAQPVRRITANLTQLDLADWLPWAEAIRLPAEAPSLTELALQGVIRDLNFTATQRVDINRSVSDVENTESAESAPDGSEEPKGDTAEAAVLAKTEDETETTVAPATPAPWSYELTSKIQDMACQPTDGIPGVSGITGDLVYGNGQGRFQLAASEGQVILPGVFKEAVSFNQLDAIVTWQPNDSGWQIGVSDVVLQRRGNMQVEGGLTLGIPDGDASMPIDLDMRFSADDVLAAKALIPLDPDVFPVEVQEWLQASILGGRVSDGRVQIRGTLADFPYENADEPGLFRVDLNLHGGRLQYAPDWPEITGINGPLVFQGRRMDIWARDGNILGVPVGPVKVWIADYHESILFVEGKAAADAPVMLGFLRETPLHEDFRHMLSVLDLQGPANLDLRLDIPLDDVDKTQVKGLIVLADNELQHSALPQPLKSIRGEVSFDNDGVRAQALAGTLFDQPVSVDLSPRVITTESESGSQESTVIDVAAKAAFDLPRDIQALSRYAPSSLLQQAEGRAAIDLQMAIVDSPDPTPLTLAVDLTDMALELPPPFGKSKGQVQKLNTRLEPAAAGGADLKASYADLASAKIRWGGTQEVWELDRGLISVGRGKQAGLPKEAGLWLDGSVDVLNLDAWSRVLKSEMAETDTNKPAMTDTLRGAELRIATLKVGGQVFKDVRTEVFRHPEEWWMSLEGPDVKGNLTWLANQSRPIIKADIQQLNLGPLTSEEEDKELPREEGYTDPRHLPGIELTAKAITINQADLGQARMVLSPVPEGVILKVVEITGSGVDLTAHGEWLRMNEASSGRLKLSVSGNRVESVIAAAGYDPTLSANKTDIDGDIYWMPNAMGLLPDSMQGRLSLKLEEGTLLAVDPGAGRALGLLNFYALPRRLQFDFTDVTSPGLTFDELKGKFVIKEGSAYTDTLRMEGPSLKMRMRGRTGIAAQDYDQIIEIVPNIKSGVTLAGTVLGGPAVGAALLIAQELFESPLEKVSELEYHLGGTWDEPVVDDVDDREVPEVPHLAKPPSSRAALTQDPSQSSAAPSQESVFPQ